MTTTEVRFASFNASLNRSATGELITDLSTPDNAQAAAVAEIIQQANPDVLLINEFDFDENREAIQLFQDNYLSVSQNGSEPVEYPFVYLAPSNTGIPSGFDLDNDGTTDGPGDAFGFGFFPGQFGMVLLSKYPIVEEEVRTFQEFLWQDMPGALLPDDPNTEAPNDWYSPEELEVFRLSSKNHWDVPVNINGEIVHVLASHPTPPVFDGEEDRNGTRNHDEIRFFADYITPGAGSYIYDDNGNFGGLGADANFVILGDQNADPFDGDSTNNAILQLLDNPLVNTSVTPSSEGGTAAAERSGGLNAEHMGDSAFDTGDFNDAGPGNLRVDYVLPSANLEITEAEVFWPTPNDPAFDLVGDFDPNLPTGFPSSDHRLVFADVEVEAEVPDSTRTTVTGINFLGEAVFETGFQLGGTEVGGISGLVYDENNQVYYAISDDRSQNAPARFYNVTIDLSDGSLEDGDVEFVGERTLLDGSGNPFPEGGIDPEGIALTSAGTLFISSEGNANDLLAPFVNEFSLEGEQFNQLPVPEKFLPTEDGTSGIRNNQAFESLTITPDERFLYTAVENALIQDGPASSLDSESAVRIIEYNLETGEPSGEFIYINDRIPVAPEPPDSFADNGLVELLALDNSGTFLALERSFAMGVGINLRLYEIQLQGATDVSDFDSLLNPDPEEELFDVDAVASKRLLLDFGELGIQLDNSQALAFGPTLDNGNQSLIVVSDNNFNESQITQFLAFELELNHIPAVTAAVETPPEIRFGDPENPDPNNAPDSDDPAIYLHPTDSGESIVITTVKNGGLRVYDLEGNELQRIAPDGIRYNNVDLIYDFSLGETTVDLAVASDRANDTLAIFQIDPNTRQLTDITAGSLSDAATSIFGVDDGEQTAYGLATYTSLVSDKSYVFVSQADGNQVAQLELVDNGSGAVDATVVRTLTVPVPPEADLEDAQVEGMVVDRELGFLYAGQEDFGIWKFSAEPDAGDNAVIVDTINDVGEGERRLEGDVEGLTIYYGEDGNGYLLASSQGDSTFAVYDRGGSNSYLGSFAIGEGNGIDGVEESDGADILSTPLGEQFPFGLLVVQDGSNEAQVTFQDPDDGEIQNFNTNFKYIGLEELAETLNFLDLEPEAFDPRNIELPSVELVFGSPGDDALEAGVTPGFDGEDALVFTGAGEDLIDLSLANSGTRIYSGSDEDELFAGEDDRLFGGEGDDILDASVGEGGNRLYGGEGNDELYAGKDDRLFGGEGDDILDASVGEGGNRLYGGDGNDSFFLGEGNRLYGGEGDDSFFVGTGGDNIITGGEGEDAFWIANSEFPEAVNTITDFEPGIDVIGIGGDLGIAAVDVSFNPVEGGVVIAAGGNDLAELLGVDAFLLSAADVDGNIIIA